MVQRATSWPLLKLVLRCNSTSSRIEAGRAEVPVRAYGLSPRSRDIAACLQISVRACWAPNSTSTAEPIDGRRVRRSRHTGRRSSLAAPTPRTRSVHISGPSLRSRFGATWRARGACRAGTAESASPRRGLLLAVRPFLSGGGCTRSRSYEGSGIGLSLVHETGLPARRGDFHRKLPIVGGTTFTVSVPIR